MESPIKFEQKNTNIADTIIHAAKNNIDSCATSDSWKRKFRLLEKAGGPRLPNLKSLSFGERLKISFNILAYLFGPFYYIAKGMWKKAILLLMICIVAIFTLSVALDFMGLAEISASLGYGAAAIFGVRANIDYYKKTVLGENGWW